MEINDFIALVASESERTVTRTVWTTPPEVLTIAAAPGGMRMTDLLSSPGRRAEEHEVHYRHILGSPVSMQTIDVWQVRHASQSLPADLRALLTRINGIHLWANVETGRAYTGLAPIEEWDLARVKILGTVADGKRLDDRYVALSYHQDGASFVVLDVESSRYFLMDSAGPDTTSPIASGADELLDWIWRTRIAPRA